MVAAALVVLLVGASIAVLRSSWFREKVRGWIVAAIADATGGQVKLAAFHLDWRHLRVELDDLEIRGKEPASKPPLFYADAVVARFRIVSLLERNIDVESLEVRTPQIYLIVYPGGGTNLPEPKVKRGGNTMETILKLAVGQFRVDHGVFEVESQGKKPFDLRGRNLNAALQYDPAGPRYRGQVSAEQLETRGMQFRLTAEVAFEREQIKVAMAQIATGESEIRLAGALRPFGKPEAEFQFDARIAATDGARALNVKLLDRGTVDAAGTARWLGGDRYLITGKVHGYNLEYRGPYTQLRGFRADAALTANQDSVTLGQVRLSGNAAGMAVAGEVGTASLRDSELDLQAIALNVLGGTFRGGATIHDFERFQASGEISGIEARRAVAQYSTAKLPWNSLVSGKIEAEGLLKRKNELRADADLVLAPAADSAPVHGQISARYDTRTDTLDLGHSTVTLPSSRVDFSGVLGRQLNVHMETTNPDDFLPVLGPSAASLPVKLENGSAVFDGTVTGRLDNPVAAGHLTARNVAYGGERADAIEGDVTASAGNVALRHATVAHGGMRADFEAAVDLRDWKVEDSSLIAGSGSIRNANASELAKTLHIDQPVTGTVSATAQVNGTVGNPLVKADVSVVKGKFLNEPFDRLTAHADYSGTTLTVSNAQVSAGAGEVQFTASYVHAPNSLTQGKLQFQAQSNKLALSGIDAIHRERPDARGTVQLSANGTLELTPGKGGQPLVRITDLRADVRGTGLELSGQSLGDTQLTATSQNQVLRAHVESDFAGSSIKGDGEWSLEGNNNGSATIKVARTELSRIAAWIFPAGSAIGQRFKGWMEGEIHIEGPALQPSAMKAQVRIPNLELSASAAEETGPLLTLHNSGPIVASLSTSTITVDTMRLVGHDTDLGVTGKISLDQKTSDLRVTGRADLAMLHDFNRDFRASGTVTADATVRGSLTSPSVSGRTEFHDATFSVADLPNGLTKANGVILFNGTRATIQSFSGETGGGKVELTGFASAEGDQTIFRIHARVNEVRVRYPEGVSTVADATLNLTGTLDRSMLSGTVTVLRTGFNPQSDFSTLIAASAQPVQTSSARSGFLGGLSFDVQINTAPDIQVQSSLTQDLAVEANLRLHGSFSNPALVGRINLTEGQVIFFGTRYTINQGSISFFNPVRIEPIFDIDLETKARGIDVTLSITGPLNKLNLTPRSDPPLQFNEIVALLATGRTPTNDPSLLQQNSAPQSWQQMGASALLGQAIASPVAGRLQRFFGVSQLRIDPSLAGVANTVPQARLSLEQQVTPNLTFTYITDVTTSNPQVIQVEWAFAKQWSVVAIRQDNGLFGIDFYYKRRF